MKKLFILAALLVFIGAAAVNAQNWDEIYRFKKQDATFPASIPLRYANKYGWVGGHDSVEQISNFKVVQTFREPLICQFSSSGITSIGKADNTDPLTFVNDVIEINGETYICLNYGTPGLLPRLHKLNKQTKHFEAESSIKFDREFWFHYLGNGMAFLFGHYFNGQDKSGVKKLDGGSILNIKTLTLSKVEGTGSDNPGLGGQYYDHSIGLDSSLYIIVGGAMRMMHYGSTEWKDGEYETVIVGGQFRKVLALSKDDAFAIWQRDSDKANLLLQMKNRKWEVRSELSYPDPATQAVTSQDFVVSSLQHYKGKLILTHSGSHVNGKSMGPIVVYDTATNAWSGLPVPFALNTRTKFGLSYVKVIADSIYLVRDNGDIFGIQPVWLLKHDGLLPIVLKSFSGVSESGTHKLFWETSVEQNVLGFDLQVSKQGGTFETVKTVSAKGAGVYNESLTPKAKGVIHYYRLRMVDKDGSFRYSWVVPLDAPSVGGLAYPNPTNGNVMVEIKEKGSFQVIDANGRQLLSRKVVVGNHQISLTPYMNGMYFVRVLNEEGELQTVHKIVLRK